MTSPDWLSGSFLIAFGTTCILMAYVGVGYVDDLRRSDKPNKGKRYFLVGWLTGSLVMSGLSAVWRGGTLLGLN